MQNITEQFIDYDVFNAYLNLDESVSAYLQKHAQDEENQLTDAQFERLGEVIDGFIASFTEKLDMLEKTYNDEREGIQKRIFYRTMLEVFIREKEVLA
jgi:hypothetical protein